MTPQVSVIVPCYNEERTIGLLLRAIEGQTWPQQELEVVISDGMSSDGTRAAIAAFSKQHPGLPIRVIDNPDRNIPAALNRAVAAAQGRVIVRFDAHSVPRADYIERCVRALDERDAANVGGAWEIQPSGDGWVPRGIAAAAGHPLGAGDARYRFSDKAGMTETVPFGAFRREWLERVGPFNEALLTNEDYEYNVRIRQAGGMIWYDPAIRSIYFARGDLSSLARQYARYGYWKGRMLLLYPRSVRWRQALPPMFVLTLGGLLVGSLVWPPALLLLTIQCSLYAGATFGVGLWEAIVRRQPGLILGFPLALWTMHLAWGGSVVWGLITGLGKRRAVRRG